MLIRFFEKPARFEYMHKWLVKPGMRILDVGCGNNSPSRTKRYYPKCLYYGLDRIPQENVEDQNLAAIEQFFEIDLSNISSLSRVPDLFFDCIILSHVVEHLENGTEVIAVLLQKLVKGETIFSSKTFSFQPALY